jgi:hypothetical protein
MIVYKKDNHLSLITLNFIRVIKLGIEANVIYCDICCIMCFRVMEFGIGLNGQISKTK